MFLNRGGFVCFGSSHTRFVVFLGGSSGFLGRSGLSDGLFSNGLFYHFSDFLDNFLNGGNSVNQSFGFSLFFVAASEEKACAQYC